MPTETADSRCAVLYVDDEEQALKYFKKGFTKDFRVFTAPDVAAAKAVLAEHHAEIGVLLTDQRMPGASGVELLTFVRQNWPEIVRIMVTAYSNMSSAIEAVNIGSVHKYLTKPIEFPALREVLHEAMELYLKNQRRDAMLNEKMSNLQRLIVADRVRSISTMASGFSHHFRNALTAITCYFEMLDAAGSEAPAGPASEMQELFQLANQERNKLLRIMEEISTHTSERKMRFEEGVAPAQLIAQAVEKARILLPTRTITVDLPAALPDLRADRVGVEDILAVMIARLAQHTPAGSPIHITAAGPIPHWNTSGIRIRVTGEGTPFTDDDVNSFFTPVAVSMKTPGKLGLEMIDGFFAAYGHGGDLLAERNPSAGPGFELQLPLNPAEVQRPPVDGPTAPLKPPSLALSA